MNLHVLFEDNHLLVVNKPAPLPTMGAEAGQPSLIELAKSYIAHRYNKPGNVYLGVVSRLDSHVTGAIVFARTSKAAARLTKQFADGLPEKKYLAIVPGQKLGEQFEPLSHWLIKDESNHRMMTCSESTGGAKEARLRVRTLAVQHNRSLIEIELLTGRKHQIRVQLASSGFPIIGDRKYDCREPFPTGIALHSRRLTIEHPTLKQSMTFACPLPDYWPRWCRSAD